jgi:adenylyltransferase/sulfurtransferase
MITLENLNEVTLNAAELSRYARHVTLPQVQLDGQKRLKATRVLCIGSGGLGSPVAMYLAAAGVGKLGIVDPDLVDASNLHRQLLHGESDIGTKKLQSAAATLREINPHVELETYDARFKSSNAREIASGYDLIVDGTDNFPTRYLSNDVAYFLNIPNVYGSIYQFEGQVSVFAPYAGGPCYRCMFPTPPKPGLVPSCAEGGVFGVLPGIVGSLQATEAIKIILGLGDSLMGRLLHIDTLTMKVRTFNLRKDPECPLCGDSPSVTELIDYEAFCGLPLEGVEVESAIVEVTPQEMQALMQDGNVIVVDVREGFERDICVIEGTKHIPLGQLGNHLQQLPKQKEVILHCKSGIRSETAGLQLKEAGFEKVKHLGGGILAWREAIEPDMNAY